MKPSDSEEGPTSMKVMPSSTAGTAPSPSSSPQPSFWQCERCFFDENIDEGPISEQICIGCRKIRNVLVWSCSECTYHNPINIKSCEVCGSICYQRDIQTLLNRKNNKQARGGLNIHHQVNSKEIMNAYKSKKRKAVALISKKHISYHALLVPLNEEYSPTTAKSSSRKSPKTRVISSRKKEKKSSEKSGQGREEESKEKASADLHSSIFDGKGLRSDHEESSEIELSYEEDMVDHEGNEFQMDVNRQKKKPKLPGKKESSGLERSLRSKRRSAGNRQKIDTEYESDESEDEEEEIKINFLKEDDIEEDQDKNKANRYQNNLNIRQIGGNLEHLNQTSKTTKDKTEAISSIAVDKGKEKKKIVQKDNSNKKTQKKDVKRTTKGQKSELTRSQKLPENHTAHLQGLRQSRRTSSFSSSSTQPTISVKQKAVVNKKPPKQKNQETKGLTESQIYKGVTTTENTKITAESKKKGKEDDRTNLKGDSKGNVDVSKVSKGKERSSSSQSHPKSNNSKIIKDDKKSSSNEHETKITASVSGTPIRTPSVPLTMFQELPSLTESSTKNDIIQYHSHIWKYQLASMHKLIGKVAHLKQMSVADFETQYFGSD